MSGWLHLSNILVLLLAAALVSVYFFIIRPFRRLRQALRRLAEKDFRPMLMKSPLGIFRKTADHVLQITELLQQLDRQIADEGFSLRAILSSMTEGVMITDNFQRIRLANEALQQMFDMGQSPINRSAMEVFRNHELQIAIEETLADGKARRIDLTFNSATRDGVSVRHFEVYAGALSPRGEENRMGVVVVFHDVTTVKNLEAVRREFVANVSHEFRTPLAIIIGYIETLLDGALDDRDMAVSSLQVMDKNTKRLTLLIDDMLAISRMEHRSPRLDVQPVNLREILDRVMDHLNPSIIEHNAEMRILWECDAVIEGDMRHLELVFSNLLGNALRYGGGSERPVLTVSATSLNEEITLIFSDNGPGIPYADQSHIFERFYRVDKGRSRDAGGTGLGLSIVKNVVIAHGGRVLLESVPGKGAAFHVILPISQSTSRSSVHA